MKWGLTKNNTKNTDLVDSFRDDFDHFFDNFFKSDSIELFDSKWVPSVDVEEDDNEIRVTAEIPGIDEKDLNVTLDNHYLTISGEKNESKEEKSKGQVIMSERRFGSFSRTIAVPEGIKTYGIKAKYKNGTLTVKLPKDESVKPRKISIDVK